MPTTTFNSVRVTYTVSGVTINKDPTVTNYPDTDPALEELLRGLQRADNWTCELVVARAKGKSPPRVERVSGLGWPVVDRHPGHVHERGWKYNIETGTRSVDRLVLSNWSAQIVDQGAGGGDTLTGVRIAITVDAKVLKNTH